MTNLRDRFLHIRIGYATGPLQGILLPRPFPVPKRSICIYDFPVSMLLRGHFHYIHLGTLIRGSFPYNHTGRSPPHLDILLTLLIETLIGGRFYNSHIQVI